MDIKPAIQKAVDGEDLDAQEAQDICTAILMGEVSDAQLGGLLIALRMKGESAAEILGFASALREAATPLEHDEDVLVDTCGTGGDESGTFNISTAAAFVVASAGVPVAKHGNRAVSSQTGSADVLSALGVNIECSPEADQRCLDEAGICFLFAPQYHGAMRHAGPVRRELGVRTIFNLVGPLANPAGATHQVIGVHSDKIMEPLAEALQGLGCRHAMIVHSSDGHDELTTTSVNHILEVEPEAFQTYDLTPHEMGLETSRLEDLLGGDAATNASIIEALLKGEDTGPRAQVVAANAGAALYIAGRARSLKEGIQEALELMTRGEPFRTLEALRRASNA